MNEKGGLGSLIWGSKMVSRKEISVTTVENGFKLPYLAPAKRQMAAATLGGRSIPGIGRSLMGANGPPPLGCGSTSLSFLVFTFESQNCDEYYPLDSQLLSLHAIEWVLRKVSSVGHLPYRYYLRHLVM